ncbi:helix-turn-helix transcriptional regulator [Trichormus sp. NMC-1]|uniref:helix-turn-helix domain-containing protein n=1 Tax=Trichormus sp. NMC-1 TaxID=1853259 RepID=UPI0008DC161D|nr:helix-turn-helix transcriptional regulator [Trichormus sp. NMC-1]
MQERQKRLAQLIEQLLQERWTQTTLSEAIGVDFTTVYRWLKGKAIPETDSKNFLRLAKLSGGNSELLQLYLDGKISLSIYRQSLESNSLINTRNSKKRPSEEIKQELLAQISMLDSADIAEVITTSVTFLKQRA